MRSHFSLSIKQSPSVNQPENNLSPLRFLQTLGSDTLWVNRPTVYFVLGNNLPLNYSKLVSQNIAVAFVHLFFSSWSYGIWLGRFTAGTLNMEAVAHIPALTGTFGTPEVIQGLAGNFDQRKVEWGEAEQAPFTSLIYQGSEAKQVPLIFPSTTSEKDSHIHTSVRKTILLFCVNKKLQATVHGTWVSHLKDLCSLTEVTSICSLS